MSTIAFRNQGKSNGEICNNYPTVFEHGFVGWGEQDGIYKWFPYMGIFHGALTKEMNKRGFETYQLFLKFFEYVLKLITSPQYSC